MKKFKEFAKKAVMKYGHVIAACAFAFVAMTSNSSSIFAFYEPEAPEGVEKFKKF